MAYYGRRVTSGDTDYGEVLQNQQRASVYNKMPHNAWGHKIGIWAGRVLNMGVPTAKLAVWSTSNLTPATRVAVHDGIAITQYQSYGGDGREYVVSVTPFKMYANINYAIGVNSTGAPLGHAMIQASRINAENEQFYQRNSVTYPTNPFGHTSSSNEGWMSAWVEYQENRAPTAATSAPNGLITTTSPTFTGTFSDPDTTYGDKMTRLRIQVTRVSNGSLMWDSGNLAATASEQSSKSFSRAYSGSALSAGVEYRWRVQVADDFGTWSAWSAYRNFTVNGGGSVTTSGPSGKQNTLQPTPFTGTWKHASGLAMNAVQVRIKQGGAVIRNGTSVAKSVANNGTISTTWAEQFGSYSLAWGVGTYSFEIRGRDTGNLWSDWSSARSFSTNNPPDIPYNLTPTNSTPSSSRPLLRATAKDLDGDSVTVKARIKNSAGTVLFTRTMSRVGTTNDYTYQTTSTDLATHATYKWDAYSYDGHLYSGAVTSEGSATKSAEASFIYGEGPVVTIYEPANGGTITTSTPLIDWDAADQVKRQVVIRNADTNEVVYDSGVVTSSSTSMTLPSGYLRNGQTYSLVVSVTNSAPLTGSSSASLFTVEYPTPDAITGFHASPEFQRFDETASSIRLTWDESSDPNFMEYLITRSDGVDELILARITSPTQNVFIDYHPESGVDYTYSIVQSTLQGLDITVSAAASVQASISLKHVILNDVFNGSDARVGLTLDSDRSFDHHDDMVLEQVWGNNAPVASHGTAQYQSFSGTFTLASTEAIQARDHIEALRALWRSRATLCYRDERGRKFFCKISKFSEDDRRVQFYTVSLSLTEVAYREGVA